MNNQIELISFHTKIIDSFIEKYNIDNKSNKIKSCGNLDIFNSSTAMRILQYQPQEQLDVVTDDKLISQRHDLCVKKFNDFFNLSFNKKHSLILTPEYSVPIESLNYLLEHSDKIYAGTLYCICCEGIKYEEFEAIEGRLKDKRSIEYNNIAIRSASRQMSVCVMFYIAKISFQLEDWNTVEKTFIVPQFKLTPMRDKYFKFEKSGLTQGKSILYLGDENSSKFLSLLCADAYNLTVLKLIQELGQNEILLFNPQLNQGAENKVFCFMREYLFQYCQDNIRIINLNWARNTELVLDDESSFIKNPWTGVYFGFNKSEFKSVLNNFPNNAFWGLDLGVDNNIGFWFTNPNEHVLSYKINSFKNSNSPSFINEESSLVADEMLIYDYQAETFKVKEYFCKQSIDDYFLKTEEFSPLNHCLKCNHKKECTKCNLNKFSALVFDNKLSDEYDMFYDGNFMGITSKQYYNTSNEKIIICKKILNMIKNNNVSQRFRHLEKNIQFIVKNIDGKEFNVVFKSTEEADVHCRIVYLKYCEKNDAELVYSKLVSKYGKKHSDNIMVFYESDDGCRVIPELNRTSILDDEDAGKRTIVRN